MSLSTSLQNASAEQNIYSCIFCWVIYFTLLYIDIILFRVFIQHKWSQGKIFFPKIQSWNLVWSVNSYSRKVYMRWIEILRGFMWLHPPHVFKKELSPALQQNSNLERQNILKPKIIKAGHTPSLWFWIFYAQVDIGKVRTGMYFVYNYSYRNC